MIKLISDRLIVLIIKKKSNLFLRGAAGFILLAGIFLGIRFISNSVVSGAVPAFPAESIQFQVENDKPNVSAEDFFVNYRLKREDVRQERKTMLSALLNSTVKETKQQAQEKWLELSSKIQKEEEIENLLKIKGFKDAVADVSGSVTVIVYASGLTPNEVMMIQDIVVHVTDIQLNKIVISSKQ
jgi:stage III sporulation protein AH